MLEALDPQTAERVRRRARLERAAAQHRGARVVHRASDVQELPARLHRTRTRDDGAAAVTEAHRCDVDHRGLRMPLARHLLVRLADGHRVDDSGQVDDGIADRRCIASQHADGEAVRARHLDRPEPALDDVRDHVGHLRGRGVLVHEDQHRGRSVSGARRGPGVVQSVHRHMDSTRCSAGACTAKSGCAVFKTISYVVPPWLTSMSCSCRATPVLGFKS